MATGTKTKATTYIANNPTIKFVIEPADAIRNARGTVIDSPPGVAVEFQGGRADITEGTDEHKGKAVVNGKPVEMSYAELNKRLKKHRGYGTDFELEPEPPKPTKADLEAAKAQVKRLEQELSKDELQEKARELDIEGRSKMSKAELAKAVEEGAAEE